MDIQHTVSPRSVEVYEFIKTFVDEHKYSPTMQEIADGLETSKSVVTYCLLLLEKHEYITRTPRTSRSILVVEK